MSTGRTSAPFAIAVQHIMHIPARLASMARLTFFKTIFFWRLNLTMFGGWEQIPYRPGGWVLHQPPWSFGFDSQTRGTRKNRRTLC
jgi:hypothetical protein